MKLSEAIEQVKLEKPHSFNDDHCTLFINEIEAQVHDFLGSLIEDRRKYKWEEDGNRELVVPAPYDRLYVSWLKARIDYCNQELESYANNQEQHMADMQDFKAWAIREDKILNKPAVKLRNWWC